MLSPGDGPKTILGPPADSTSGVNSFLGAWHSRGVHGLPVADCANRPRSCFNGTNPNNLLVRRRRKRYPQCDQCNLHRARPACSSAHAASGFSSPLSRLPGRTSELLANRDFHMLTFTGKGPNVDLRRRDTARLLAGRHVGGHRLWPAPMVRGPGRRSGQSRTTTAPCIMIFNLGAPSNMDLWDMKPDAPAEVRGPFKPIATASSAIQFSEILPRHAQIADKISLVRSVHHSGAAVHDAGWQMMQTGRLFSGGVNTPHLGSVVSYLEGRKTDLPPFVVLPELMGRGGGNLPNGQAGGFLGKAHDPFSLNADPSQPGFRVPDLLPPKEIGSVRLDRRRKIRELVDDAVATFEASENASLLDGNFQSAFRLMTSAQARAAFDLAPGTDDDARAIRHVSPRPMLPSGAAAGRERCAVRDDQRLSDRVRRDHVGHPRVQAIHFDRGDARHCLPDVRQGLYRP